MAKFSKTKKSVSVLDSYFNDYAVFLEGKRMGGVQLAKAGKTGFIFQYVIREDNQEQTEYVLEDGTKIYSQENRWATTPSGELLLVRRTGNVEIRLIE